MVANFFICLFIIIIIMVLQYKKYTESHWQALPVT